jgi:hypothetical protein
MSRGGNKRNEVRKGRRKSGSFNKEMQRKAMAIAAMAIPKKMQKGKILLR